MDLLGKSAHDFQILARTKQRYWQISPPARLAMKTLLTNSEIPLIDLDLLMLGYLLQESDLDGVILEVTLRSLIS